MDCWIDVKKDWIECYMGNSYVGGMGYADDFKLLCPSLNGMQQMVDMLNMLMNIILNLMAVRVACFCLKVDSVGIHREC